MLLKAADFGWRARYSHTTLFLPQAMMESGEVSDGETNGEGQLWIYPRARRFPTDMQLLEAGRTDVLAAIAHHGGSDRVAKRMGLRATRRPRRHWHNPKVAAKELRGFVVANKKCFSLPGGRYRMPTHTELRKHDRQVRLTLLGSHARRSPRAAALGSVGMQALSWVSRRAAWWCALGRHQCHEAALLTHSLPGWAQATATGRLCEVRQVSW
jgi:hypothetical protein